MRNSGIAPNDSPDGDGALAGTRPEGPAATAEELERRGRGVGTGPDLAQRIGRMLVGGIEGRREEEVDASSWWKRFDRITLME